MLTALDLINRLLNYFNIQDKPKGRAFTVVAFIANFYLLYVAIQGLRYKNYRLQGSLFLFLFLIFLYFIVLNFIYYYTDKKVKWDISPRIEKALGGSAKQRQAAVAAYTQVAEQPANGVFKSQQVLRSTLDVTPQQQAAINELAAQMEKQGILTLKYHGLDDNTLARIAQKTAAPVLAMGAPVPLPYYDLTHTADNRWVIVGGLNSLDYHELATVRSIGLTPIDKAASMYRLAAAQVVLSGGPQKTPSRTGMNSITEPFTIEADLAYLDTNKQ